MREEIKVGELAIRFLVEGDESAGPVAVFEFDVPAGSKVAAAHSHDGYEETTYGLDGEAMSTRRRSRSCPGVRAGAMLAPPWEWRFLASRLAHELQPGGGCPPRGTLRPSRGCPRHGGWSQ
jgi:hypothetical protein